MRSLAALAIILALVGVSPAGANPVEWERMGRPLPERLEPRAAVDPGLPAYIPSRGGPVSGWIEGFAPAILPRLAGRWVAAFQARHPEATVAIPPPYEPPLGAASKRLGEFLDGKFDFALLSRDLAASDLARFRASHGYDPLAIPVANGSWRHFGFIDSIAIIVHPDNPLPGLSLAQLDAIFSRTRHRGHAPVATWGDLGVAAWQDRPLHVVGIPGPDGDEPAKAQFLRARVLDGADGQRGKWRLDGDGDEGDASVVARVAADPLAIGIAGMGHLTGNVRPLALAGGEGEALQAPDYDNHVAGHYPLIRPVYLLVARPPGRRLDPVLAEFIRFILSREGQEIVADQGVFLPLRARQALLSVLLVEEGGR